MTTPLALVCLLILAVAAWFSMDTKPTSRQERGEFGGIFFLFVLLLIVAPFI